MAEGVANRVPGGRSGFAPRPLRVDRCVVSHDARGDEAMEREHWEEI